MLRRVTVPSILLGLLFLAAPALADVALDSVSWETIGSDVRFHLRFANPDPVNPSGPVAGGISSQPFGAFLPDYGPIGSFNVPPMAPDSFFDIYYDIALADLPPSAEELTPGNPPGTAPGKELGSAQQLCPPDNFWNGNVDIFWGGAGGTGQVNYHFGTILVCPGAANSYIHVIMGCDDPAGLSWSFSPLCSGWTASLVVDAGFTPGGPAPNPIPPGFFDGWICIAAGAGVPIGNTCTASLNLLCGTQPATINVTAEACDWATVPVEATTWGKIKSQYN